MSERWSPPPPLHDVTKPRAPRGVVRSIWRVVVGGLAIIGALTLAFVVLGALAVPGWEAAEEEGRAFGATTTDDLCVERALQRLEERNPLWLPLEESSFLEGCLQVSAESAELCQGVPLPDDGPAVERWSEGRCRAAGIDGLACPTLVVEVVHACQARSGE